MFFTKLFMTITAELWLRGRIDTLETVFQSAARNLLFGQPKHYEIFMLADETCRDTGHPRNRMPAGSILLAESALLAWFPASWAS